MKSMTEACFGNLRLILAHNQIGNCQTNQLCFLCSTNSIIQNTCMTKLITEACFGYLRLIPTKHFNWEQLRITNYASSAHKMNTLLLKQ